MPSYTVPKEEVEDMAKFVAPGGELERLENWAREQIGISLVCCPTVVIHMLMYISERESSAAAAEKEANNESISKTGDGARKEEPFADKAKGSIPTTPRHSNSNSKSA